MALTKTPIELSSTPGIVDNSNATAITIDSSENVGIGTSPDAATVLHVQATEPQVLISDASSPLQRFMAFDVGLAADEDTHFITVDQADALAFGEKLNGNDRVIENEWMRITNAGNVGIGVTPTQVLHAKTASGNAYARIERASLSTGQVGLQIGGGTSSVDWFTYMPSGSNDLAFFGNSAERMRIDSSGNVIIGSTSLNASGSVGFTQAGQIRSVFASGVANDSLIGAISGVSNGFQIAQDTSNNQSYKFHNGGTPSVTIDSSGIVMVATTNTNPHTFTTGSGLSINSAGMLNAAKQAAVVQILNRTGNSDGVIQEYKKDGTTVGSIGVDYSTEFYMGGGGGGFYINAASIRPTTGGGSSTLSDNTHDFGSASHRFKDLYLSGGVVFGTTGGSVTGKTLDDYEEGTWTPTIVGGTTSTTFSGRYTKIGRMVYANFYSGGFAITNASGIASIGGLPFTVKSTGDGYGASATFTHVTCFSDAIQTGYCNAGGNNVYPTPAQSAATTTFINSSLVYIMMSVAYEAA